MLNTIAFGLMLTSRTIERIVMALKEKAEKSKQGVLRVRAGPMIIGQPMGAGFLLSLADRAGPIEREGGVL
jgi:hypothetical protein